ncbi:MAG TPA: hypothetical protein PLM56_12800 [Cyclobacteriaceae bacterium]|jgi:hypothetical protein|nr:hypothetical protein [Cytophagales bacterium]HMR58462.1 hypothetical protein [Cyclobacteriaceae bacterium]HNT50948.1 hypothetical protein [Cyclobacteriaceae bacterium]HRE68302.1 hypothetical protein [Cyclobacteriaceae bacterium]HRF34375.1 hypothetical protein [Cyclobacteriaceae bacterium]
MKRVVITLVACLLFITTHAQNQKEVIGKFNEYSQLILNKEFDKALDFVHDGIFEIAPREQMKSILVQTFNNPMLEVEMTMPEVKGISSFTEIENKHYLKFNSKNVVKMRFSPEAIGEGETAINKVKQGLIAQFGEANVVYEEATRFFNVTTVKPVIAASTDKKNWKFVTIDNDQLIPMLEKFLPKAVIDLKVD